MENHFSKLMSELNKEIFTINSSEITLEQSEKFKQIILEYYLRLQDFTATYEFPSEQEEINTSSTTNLKLYRNSSFITKYRKCSNEFL